MCLLYHVCRAFIKFYIVVFVLFKRRETHRAASRVSWTQWACPCHVNTEGRYELRMKSGRRTIARCRQPLDHESFLAPL